MVTFYLAQDIYSTTCYAMTENELSNVIIKSCIEIHSKLGPGLLESVYEEVLYFELTSQSYFVERQKSLPVYWKGNKMNIGFRTDLIIEKIVLVEIKSVENMSPVFAKTVLTYLRLSNIKLGLLINFNVDLLKDGITRLVNNL